MLLKGAGRKCERGRGGKRKRGGRKSTRGRGVCEREPSAPPAPGVPMGQEHPCCPGYLWLGNGRVGNAAPERVLFKNASYKSLKNHKNKNHEIMFARGGGGKLQSRGFPHTCKFLLGVP